MFRVLTALTGAATLALGVAWMFGPAPFYLPIAALVLAAVLVLSGSQRLIIRFLLSLYTIAFLAFSAVTLSADMGLWPEAAQPYLPPPHAALIAALLGLVQYGVSFIPGVRTVIELAAPYFETEERGVLTLGRLGAVKAREGAIGLFMFGTLIAINVTQVYLNVIFSFWNNRFYTALQEKNEGAFWTELRFFSIFATIWIIIAVYEYVLTQYLDIRWRRWMTVAFIGRWMNDGVHYRLRLVGDDADNPDQRIADDVQTFVARTRFIYISMFSSLLNLYAFIQILWGLSSSFPYMIGGFELSTIPGYLVWIALILAIVATGLTHLIGRPLVGLNFRQERVEADFRFQAARLREYGEQIALLEGEAAERAGLMARFRNVIDNWLALTDRQKKLTWFTSGYGQASVVLPYLILAPTYFASKDMKLGDLTQTAGAFSRVQDAFSFFVDFYTTLASYQAVINRLTGFKDAMARAEALGKEGPTLVTTARGGDIVADTLALKLPDGRPLLADGRVRFARGERTLITGPSGSGKTTLMRAFAGIWPFGSGKVAIPENDDVMLVPQQPYLPLGTLRGALCYPSAEDKAFDTTIVSALKRVGLEHLIERLDAVEPWMISLSGGEKQRVALVRAMLHKPKWLFLDESTSALDEQAEADMYAALREVLPDTAIISIGHRGSLAALHDRRVAIEPAPTGGRIVEASLEEFARSP
ncbi:MAG: ABC transporter ATP-binding protein/permease [Labrys sp. (in: a-proteobacteria)]